MLQFSNSKIKEMSSQLTSPPLSRSLGPRAFGDSHALVTPQIKSTTDYYMPERNTCDNN